MESTEEPAELVERVAALDVGKAALMACVRVPHEDRPGPARPQEIREYATLSRSGRTKDKIDSVWLAKVVERIREQQRVDPQLRRPQTRRCDREGQPVAGRHPG